MSLLLILKMLLFVWNGCFDMNRSVAVALSGHVTSKMLDQWFSTFFSSRHTKDQRKFGGTLTPKSFVKYFKKSIFSQKRIGKVRNKKIWRHTWKQAHGTPVEKHCVRCYLEIGASCPHSERRERERRRERRERERKRERERERERERDRDREIDR